MDLTSNVLQILIFSIASFLHGITGMAFPMIGTTSLSLAFSLPTAITMIAIPSIIMNLIVLFSNNKNGFKNDIYYYFSKYKALIFSVFIGSILGIKILLILPIGIMYIVMSLVTFIYLITEFFSDKGLIKKIKVSTGFSNTIFFGLFSGIIGGATNAMSPILLMYIFSKTQDKDEIVKSSNICYLVGKIVQIFMLWENFSHLEKNEVSLILVITIVSILFLFVGVHFRKLVSDQLFKNMIYIILLILSIKVGISGMEYYFN